MRHQHSSPKGPHVEDSGWDTIKASVY
jgi:hypothetical protein